tara:strand:- start:571 stop:861 length:291 start_codon:yes stop_codon:yes gene_type:complete
VLRKFVRDIAQDFADRLTDHLDDKDYLKNAAERLFLEKDLGAGQGKPSMLMMLDDGRVAVIADSFQDAYEAIVYIRPDDLVGNHNFPGDYEEWPVA